MLWTSFPTSLDPSAISAVFDLALRRRAFDRSKDALTIFNVAGYAYSSVVTTDPPITPDGPVMAPTVPIDDAQVLALEESFAQATHSGQSDAPAGAMAAIDWTKWLGLLRLALDLLGSMK